VGLTLRLVRHGRTTWNEEGRYAGHCDIGVSVPGRSALAELVLPAADYTSVVSSDLRRCRETADALGVAPRWEPSLREFDFGDLEGLTWNDLDAVTQEALADYDRFVAPGGESVASFGRRVDAFTQSLHDGLHLVITHGGVIRHLQRLHGSELVVAPGEWCDLEVSRR